VLVVFGNRRIPAKIAQILPVSGVYAGTQQLLTGNRPATQIACIRFDADGLPPPLNTTVDVRGALHRPFCPRRRRAGPSLRVRSSLTRWRQRMGEEKLQALLQESLAVATRTCEKTSTRPVGRCPTGVYVD
jgi:hypothetical protein